MKFLLGMLVVAAFLSAASAARADVFNFTFTPNLAACSLYFAGSACADSGSGTFTTDPYQTSIDLGKITAVYAGYIITSMTGSVDGYAINGCVIGYVGGCGEIETYGSFNSLSFNFPSTFTFQAAGQHMAFPIADLGPWRNLFVNIDTGTGEPINMSIVHVPEPSTGLLVLIGLGLLFAIQMVPKLRLRFR